MNLNDALALPMADLFDPKQASWTFHAEAADALRATKLPIPAERFATKAASQCPRRSARWWAAAMRGQDFRTEDHLDTDAFNSALWRGLGQGPEPADRSGADLRTGRQALLSLSAGRGC
jgi:hypothetical protein